MNILNSLSNSVSQFIWPAAPTSQDQPIVTSTALVVHKSMFAKKQISICSDAYTEEGKQAPLFANPATQKDLALAEVAVNYLKTLR